MDGEVVRGATTRAAVCYTGTPVRPLGKHDHEMRSYNLHTCTVPPYPTRHVFTGSQYSFT